MSGAPGPDDRSLPVDLHFPDPRILSVDIDSIVRRGTRMRRNRRMLAGAGAAAVIVVLGVSGAYLVPGPSPSAASVTGTASVSAPASSSRFETTSVYRDHPPTGGRITVIGTMPNPEADFTMSLLAWPSGGQLCSGTADLTSATDNSIACADPPSELSSGGPAVAAPHVVAHVTDLEGSQVVIGFAAGDVTRVSLKIHGQEYSAKVVPLSGAPSTGAYLVWVSPRNGAVTDHDFAQITGYDSRGEIVARDLSSNASAPK